MTPGSNVCLVEIYTAKYWFSRAHTHTHTHTHTQTHTHTLHFRAYQTTQKPPSGGGEKWAKVQTHVETDKHLFVFMVDDCMCAALVCSGAALTCGCVCHVWKAWRRRRRTPTHTHTQTHRRVINSITHTPVNTNEAKTNPFLFMFCLRFNKKAFFSPRLPFIIGAN